MHSFKEVVSIFEQHISNSDLFPNEPDNLYEPCRYIMSLSAKRVRPALCLMGNEVFGDINEGSLHAATAIELFHNFTLVHDDIMDEAPLRRGNTTVHTKYGLTAGILSGDIMLIRAYEELAKVNTRQTEILQLFNTTATEVCEGQQLDMDFESRNDVSVEEYMNMIALKTSVLLACSLKMGALLSGANEKDADQLYAFGKNLGLAFQLQDDYLDAFGDASKVGKQIGGDIKANKKTYLLIKALELTHDAPEQIKQLLASEGDDKVERMLGLFKEVGVDTLCKDMIKQYSDHAFESLEAVAADSTRKQPLKELAQYLLKRDK